MTDKAVHVTDERYYMKKTILLLTGCILFLTACSLDANQLAAAEPQTEIKDNSSEIQLADLKTGEFDFSAKHELVDGSNFEDYGEDSYWLLYELESEGIYVYGGNRDESGIVVIKGNEKFEFEVHFLVAEMSFPQFLYVDLDGDGTEELISGFLNETGTGIHKEYFVVIDFKDGKAVLKELDLSGFKDEIDESMKYEYDNSGILSVNVGNTSVTEDLSEAGLEGKLNGIAVGDMVTFQLGKPSVVRMKIALLGEEMKAPVFRENEGLELQADISYRDGTFTLGNYRLIEPLSVENAYELLHQKMFSYCGEFYDTYSYDAKGNLTAVISSGEAIYKDEKEERDYLDTVFYDGISKDGRFIIYRERRDFLKKDGSIFKSEERNSYTVNRYTGA